MSVYLDESIRKVDRVYAVGGYLFTAPGVKRFERAWRGTLDDVGIDRFHMSEFENRQGQFRHWNESQRKSYLNRLIKIIARTSLCQVSAAIDEDAFNRLTPEDRAVTGMPNAYVAAAWHCLGIIAGWLIERPYSDPIAFYLDQVGPGVGKKPIIEAFAIVQKRKYEFWSGARFDSVTWGSSKELLPLQAADFAVYECAKEAVALLGRADRPIRESGRRLFLGTRAEAKTNWLLDEENLQSFVDARRTQAWERPTSEISLLRRPFGERGL